MVKIQKNLMLSFGRVRHDIVKLQEQVLKLAETQEKLRDEVYNNNNKIIESNKKISKNTAKCKIKQFVASKTGEKFHIPECPFAKNIHPHSKVMFKSKKSALNAGYKPDVCVLK
jgi:hypothetical protein